MHAVWYAQEHNDAPQTQAYVENVVTKNVAAAPSTPHSLIGENLDFETTSLSSPMTKKPYRNSEFAIVAILNENGIQQAPVTYSTFQAASE